MGTSAHTEWVTTTINEHCANQDAVKDIVCPYIGTCFHLGKGGETHEEVFYVMYGFPAKDAAAASEALKILKAHGVDTLKEEGALGMTIIPPSAMDSVCPEEKDDTRIRYLKVFKSKADWDKHQETI